MKKASISTCLVALTMLFTACSASPSPSPSTSQGGTTATATAPKQELVYNAGGDANAYDPRNSSGLDQRTVIMQVYEPLFKADADGKMIGGAAESWTLSDDNKTLTIKIRDHKWSDGKPVIAQDFVYSFQTALDPGQASKSATSLNVIQNASEILAGEMKPEELSVKAIDEKTLEIVMASANPFFMQDMSSGNFCPVPSHIDATNVLDEYTLDPKTYVGNGPFKMVSWSPKEKMVFEKNPNYYDADKVKLDKLTYVFVSDANTAYAGFQNKEIDVLTGVPATEIEKLKSEGLLSITNWAAVEYYAFNQNGMNTVKDPEVLKALSNKDVRWALALAVDRDTLVTQVTKGGQTPATGFVPKGVITPDGDFREQKSYFSSQGDVEKAKELLAKAGYPEGKGFPTIEIFYNTNENNKKVAEAIQEMWRKNLGINVSLTNKETAVFASERAAGLAQIARCGNTCSTYKPSALSLFTTQNMESANEAKWSNAAYDELIKKAESESDVSKMMEYYRQAEDMLMDEMIVMPLYYYVRAMAHRPEVKGIILEGSGLVRFQNAYIQ